LWIGCDKDSGPDGHQDRGEVSDKLSEASGLVASFANPGCLWTLNDGGNPAEVFLIDSLARTKIVCKLNGIENRDWEDISIGSGPDSTKKYVYVADIGDNNAANQFKYIYRFIEPIANDSTIQAINDVEKFVLEFPDEKRDFETLMIDPLTSDMYLVSKREDNVNIYFSKYPFQADTLKMKKVLTLPITLIVAGSISADGQQVLMKSYKNIYYWKRAGEKTLIELLAKTPKLLPYEGEHQGEAICWNTGATGFYTLSESPLVGPKAQLKFYLLK
jgi:hypothetical protein